MDSHYKSFLICNFQLASYRLKADVFNLLIALVIIVENSEDKHISRHIIMYLTGIELANRIETLINIDIIESNDIIDFYNSIFSITRNSGLLLS